MEVSIASDAVCLRRGGGSESVRIDRVSGVVSTGPTAGQFVVTTTCHSVFGIVELYAEYLVLVQDAMLVTTVDSKRIYRVVHPLRLVHVRGDEDEKAKQEFIKFLSEFSFCFSPDYHFSHTLQRWATRTSDEKDRRFFWNLSAARRFLSAGAGSWVTAVTDAFVGVVCEGPAVRVVVVSRRSMRRQGARFYCRGLDFEGSAANFVETEQIVHVKGQGVSSWVQVRGSIPLIWHQQQGDEIKPLPRVTLEPNWLAAHFRHMDELFRLYAAAAGGRIDAVNLIDQSGPEAHLGHMYKVAVKIWNAANPTRQVNYVWFDFHHECKNNKYSAVDVFCDRSFPAERCFVAREGHGIDSVQNGVMRTNCIDCLDRTNVWQSVMSRRMLLEQFRLLGVTQEFPLSPFQHVWAENADEMSRRYTGVGALKTDFTKTGKRTGKGVVQDGIKSVKRLAQHVFKDGGKQAFLDTLLGRVRFVRRDQATAVPGKVQCFLASGVFKSEMLSCTTSLGTAPPPSWMNVCGSNLISVEIHFEQRVLVLFNMTSKWEQVIPLTCVFSVCELRGKFAGVRLRRTDAPEQTKLFFHNRQAILEFIRSVAPPLSPSQVASPTLQLPCLLLSWKSASVGATPAELQPHDFFSTAIPSSSFRSHGLIVFALQDTQIAAAQSSLSPSLRFVSHAQSVLGLDFELVAFSEGCGGRAALVCFVRKDFSPLFEHPEYYHVYVGRPVSSASSASASSSSSSSSSASGHSIGCGVVFEICGTSLCFLSSVISSTEVQKGSQLRLASDNHSKGGVGSVADGGNAFFVASHCFWMGSGSASCFDLTPWLGLSVSQSRGFILGCSRDVKNVLSSDGVVGQNGADHSERYPVATSFSLPLARHASSSSYVVLRCSVWNVSLSGLRSDPGHPVVLRISSSMSVLPSASFESRDGFWKSPICLDLLLLGNAFQASDFVSLCIESSNSRLLGVGRLYLRDLREEAQKVMLYASGSNVGHLTLSSKVEEKKRD